MTLAHTVLVIAPQHIQLTAELAGLDAIQPDFEAAEAEVETLRNKAIDEELRVITARRKLQRDWNRKIDELQANSGSSNIIVQRLVPPPKPDETQVEGYAEYISGLGQLQVEEEAVEVLRRDVAAATDRAERLRVRVASRDQLFSDLDKLYKLVFDGPTPDAPEDDALEWQFVRAQSQQERLTEVRESHKIMRSHLDNALRLARKLDEQFRNAVRCAEIAPKLMAGFTLSNEANSAELAETIGRCRFLASELETAVRQANAPVKARSGRSDSPTLISLSPVEIPQSIKNGKVFEYMGTRLESQLPLRDSPVFMQRASNTAVRALRELEFEHQRAGGQALKLQADLAEATSEVKTLRLQLHALRRQIFERVLKENSPEAPPAAVPVETPAPAVPEASGSGTASGSGSSSGTSSPHSEVEVAPTPVVVAPAVDLPPEYRRH